VTFASGTVSEAPSDYVYFLVHVAPSIPASYYPKTVGAKERASLVGTRECPSQVEVQTFARAPAVGFFRVAADNSTFGSGIVHAIVKDLHGTVG
jgi:hypothetical protein